jgi:hypothetical protein
MHRFSKLCVKTAITAALLSAALDTRQPIGVVKLLALLACTGLLMSVLRDLLHLAIAWRMTRMEHEASMSPWTGP